MNTLSYSNRLRLPKVPMRMLCTTVQLADHQNHSTVTVHSPSLIPKVHKAPPYYMEGVVHTFQNVA